MDASADFRVVSSTGMMELTGFSDDELLGVDDVAAIVAAEPCRSTHHQSVLNYAGEKGSSFQYSVALRHKDGHVFAAKKLVDILPANSAHGGGGGYRIRLISCEHVIGVFRLIDGVVSQGNQNFRVLMGDDFFAPSQLDILAALDKDNNSSSGRGAAVLVSTASGVSMYCSRTGPTTFTIRRGEDMIDERGQIVGHLPRQLNAAWTLTSFITEGGFSIIYGAVNSSGVQACVKSMHKEDCSELELTLQELDNEVRIHSSMHHDNIAQVFEVFETTTHLYLVMELLGETLDDISVYYDGLGEANARGYFVQMARAVEYLHQNYIVHRDIKLANFCCEMDPNQHVVKLIDFGFAIQKTKEMWLKRNLTLGCGSFMFSSPEVREPNPLYAGWEADVYSLGISLWVLLTDERFCSDEFLTNALASTKKIFSAELFDLLNLMLIPTSQQVPTLPALLQQYKKSKPRRRKRIQINQVMQSVWVRDFRPTEDH